MGYSQANGKERKQSSSLWRLKKGRGEEERKFGGKREYLVTSAHQVRVRMTVHGLSGYIMEGD